MSNRVSRSDLERMVDNLNNRYGKSENSAVMFALDGAYGGWKLVIKANLRYNASWEVTLTYGYVPKRELQNQIYNLNHQEVRRQLKRTHKMVMDDYKRKPKSL